MRIHRPNARRVPDWQVDRFDSKGRWLLPWAIFAVTLGFSLTRVLFSTYLPFLGYPVLSNLPLRLANGIAPDSPSVWTIRIDSARTVHVGDASVVFVVPAPGLQDRPRLTDAVWRRQIRRLFQSEARKHVGHSAILIDVAPDVPWGLVAAVCVNVQGASLARQHLVVREP